MLEHTPSKRPVLGSETRLRRVVSSTVRLNGLVAGCVFVVGLVYHLASVWDVR